MEQLFKQKNRLVGMRNPLFKCWREVFGRATKCRYVPTDLKLDDRVAQRPNAPRRRKTDRFPR